ncbi:hypothetical protein GIB67_010901, partial [Kingdonia uniflora]
GCPDPKSEYKGYPKTNGRGLDPRSFGPFVNDENDSFKTISTDVPPSNEPSIPQSNIHLSNELGLTNAPQSNEHFQTIPINVPLSNEHFIPQSSIHLSNEPMLTNAPPSNEPTLTNVPLSIEPEHIIGQTEFQFEPQPEQVKYLVDYLFKSVAYTEDPYDFCKEFNIGDLYQDRIELKNHIRAYAVVNKFNLEHVLSNEYKIVVRCKGHKCSRRIYATRLVGSAIFRLSTYCSVHTYIRVETKGGNAYKATSSRWVTSIIKQKLRKDPNYKPSRIIDDMQIHHNIDVTFNLAWRAKKNPTLRFVLISDRNPRIINVVPKLYDHIYHQFTLIWHLTSMVCHFFRYGVAYTNHVESWNNIILKVRDLPIHVFIEELPRICSEISYTYRKEAEKSQARLTPYATDHCESRKFIADSLTCRFVHHVTIFR